MNELTIYYYEIFLSLKFFATLQKFTFISIEIFQHNFYLIFFKKYLRKKMNSNDLNTPKSNEETCPVPVRDKCIHFKINAEIDVENYEGNLVEFYESNLSEDCMHGDIVTGAKKFLRSLEVYFVNSVWETNEDGKNKLKRHLVQKDLSSSGYCCVPIEVTIKIKDPVTFYENAFKFDDYDEIDFSGIEIDTKYHQNIIRRFTGGKPVHFSRKCFYFLSYNEWDLNKGIFKNFICLQSCVSITNRAGLTKIIRYRESSL